MGVVLPEHPVGGESHIEHHANRKVAKYQESNSNSDVEQGKKLFK